MIIKTERERAAFRTSGSILAAALKELCVLSREGVTAAEAIAKLAGERGAMSYSAAGGTERVERIRTGVAIGRCSAASISSELMSTVASE